MPMRGPRRGLLLGFGTLFRTGLLAALGNLFATLGALGTLGAFLALGLFLGLLDDGRRRDRGDREVTVGDRQLHVLGQIDGADMDAVANFEPRQVGGQEFRNAVGAATQLDRMADDVENAADADAGALVLVLEHHLALAVEARRGAEPLYWDDVAVGAAIPPVIKGPLTITDIIAWYSATQGSLPYGGAHGDALRYRRRHDDYHINPETGAKDAAGRGHLETETARDVGMGGAYDVGPQRISWAQHMLCNWMGDHGFLHKLNASVRRPNLVGDTIWWRGTVGAKREVGAVKFVEITVEARNQNDKVSAFGTAVVALPSRADGPVPLPLQPDE